MNKRAVIYTRYSTSKQTQNSTETQIQKCLEFCKEKKLDVVNIFSDEETTGTNTKREQFLKMITLAELKQFDCVVIYDITRGSRDVVDWFEFRKEMRKLGIEVLSATERLGDIYNPSDFFVELIQIGSGQQYVLQGRQKSIDGRNNKAKSGVFLGGYPPLGYDIVEQKYVINHREAEAVKQIFNLYDSGKSYDYILASIKHLNIIGKRGKALNKNSLYYILKNPRYTGTYIWNEHLYKEMHHYMKKAPNKDIVVIEDSIPQIIDKDLFNRVQEKMKDKSVRSSKNARHKYLLSGLLVCEKCGGKFFGNTSKNQKGIVTTSYICKNKKYGCSMYNVSAKLIEDEVKQAIKNFILTFNKKDFVDKFVKHNLAVNSKSYKDEYLNIEKEIFNITIAIKKGVVYDELLTELSALKSRKSELDKIIKKETAKEELLKIYKNNVIDIIEEFSKDLTDEKIEKLIKSFVLKIIVKEDGTSDIILGIKNATSLEVANATGCGGRI